MAKNDGSGKKHPPVGGSDGDRPIRLHAYMASCGVASRRKCEEIIAAHRVQINGTTVTRQGETVTSGDIVTVDGRRITPVRQKLYIALHKPPGYICANADPDGRPLAVDLLKPAFPQRLFNIGRLDYLSSGLILFTNDGEFGRLISHPSAGIEKEYLVESRKEIDDSFLEEYKKGLTVEGETYRLKEFERKHGRSVRIVLEEGKNREIRNAFQSRNIAVKRVHRIRIGCVTVSGLAPGRFRMLTDRELKWFFDHANRGKKNDSRH